jgi:hypothetical protein
MLLSEYSIYEHIKKMYVVHRNFQKDQAFQSFRELPDGFIITTREISSHFNVSRQFIVRLLGLLVKRKLIIKHGVKKGVYYTFP